MSGMETTIASMSGDNAAANAAMTRIYLAPTATSLDGFKQICDDTSINTGITELVFLYKAVVEAPWSSGKIYQNKYEYMAACEKRSALFPSEIPQDFVFSTHTLAQSFKAYKTLLNCCKYDASRTTETLSQSLPKLLNLRRIVIATSIDKPGLNADCCTYADFKGRTRTAGERMAKSFIETHFAGVDKFVQELSKADLPVTSLEIGNGLSDRLWHDLSEPHNPISERCFAAIARKLTHVTICIENDSSCGKYDDPDSPLWRDFLTAAVNLTNLRIYTFCSKQEAGNILPMALNHNTYRNLHTVELIGELGHPASVRAASFNGFARRHADTLRQVNFSGIVLVNWYVAEDTKKIMRSSLKYLKEMLQLESATMLLRRSASAQGAESTSCPYGRNVPVEELDKLANDLGLTLNGDMWDFGEYMMR